MDRNSKLKQQNHNY